MIAATFAAVLHRLAQLLSVALHPLLVPTYLLLLLRYGLSSPAGGAARPSLILQIWLLTFVLPSLLIGLLARLGFVSSVELPDRRQRTLPLLLAATCFAAATVWLAQAPQAGPLLSRLFGAITLSVLLTTLITRWWKISAHGVGMGGPLCFLALLLPLPSLAFPATLGWWLLALLTVAGVAWARLQLRAHTPAQVAAGLALGAAVAGLVGLP